MVTLRSQRLEGIEWYFLPRRFDGCGYACLPLHFVWVEGELVGGGIVEYGHFLGADNDEALLFERMQPTDEDVGLHAARKLEFDSW